jgi:hypothetical protein
MTPARSSQGCPTLPSSSPRATTDASFLRPLPSPADPLTSFALAKCCSPTHQSTLATRGLLPHHHSPRPIRATVPMRYSSEVLLPATPKIESPSPCGASRQAPPKKSVGIATPWPWEGDPLLLGLGLKGQVGRESLARPT